MKLVAPLPTYSILVSTKVSFLKNLNVAELYRFLKQVITNYAITTGPSHL